MRITAALTGSLRQQMAAELAAGERATRAAIDETTRAAVLDLRGQVRAAGLGDRVANAWRNRTYPAGPSLSAAGAIWSNAPHIHHGFDRGTPIRSAAGFFLAIPTENAPARGAGGKRISPSTFPEHRFGPLRFVFRRGAPSLLVVDNVRINRSGRIGRRAADPLTKRGALKRGLTTVVMFILVPQVRLRKALSIAETARRHGARLPGMILARWDAEART